MKVPIDNITFAESEYHRGNKIWKAQTLYDFAKAKEYPVLNMPLWNIDLTAEPFECNQLHSFIFQCKRVNQCSLKYPIILDEVGQIADGYHRLCKAILEGKETIKLFGYWKCRHLIEFWRNKYEKTCKSHYSGICGSRLSDLW